MTPIWGNFNVVNNSEQTIIAAPTAGSNQALHITALIVANTTAVANSVTIKDGASGATIMVITFAAAAGTQIVLFGAMGLRLGREKALRAISSAATPNLQITAVGYVDL